VGSLLAATPALGADPPPMIQLPEPRTQGSMPLETAIQLRRSIRNFAQTPLALADVGQLLWSAQGITLGAGLRAAPSAGALYPLEVDLVAVRVVGIEPGVYRYIPKTHTLVRRAPGDKGATLGAAALHQGCVSQASAVVVLSAVYERTTRKYGQRGIRYVHAEAGHAAQNVCLQAVALQLGTVHIGAFHDEEVSRVLQLADDEKPLVLLPIGKPDR
jgi:SagB-type dehydrogenase family enzyme